MRFAFVCSTLLWSLGLAMAPASPAQAQDLVIRLEDRGQGGFRVLAGTQTIDVGPDMAARLAAIRFTMECAVEPKCSEQKTDAVEGTRPVLDAATLRTLLIEAGNTLLAPLSNDIRRAARIRIVSPAGLLKIGLDVLHLHGQPLFVQKPIVYAFDADRPASVLAAKDSWFGLLISDQTADPQRAVFDVAKRFPRSERLDAAGLDLTRLRSHPAVDFVVLSAHGRAGYVEKDYIELPSQEVLSPADIARLRPQLVYFDSCNLGISTTYLEALRRAGTKYAVAPMLSNEAGNSSTRTIEAYFEALAKGVHPVTALHVARKQLYSVYQSEPLITLLWRAFPFRIYILN
jgi:hypothetical protein